MNERDSFMQAINARFDDDMPRLVFADWIEENDDPEHAQFIREQCELARVEPWDAIAVQYRAERRGIVPNPGYKQWLPKVDDELLGWDPEHCFRRGFAHTLTVRQVDEFLKQADRLFHESPVRQLQLPTATLSEWRRFIQGDWLPRIESIHFYGRTTPVEPLRELIRCGRATGLREIIFGRASGPSMPDILGDLFASKLGQQLTRLGLQIGPSPVDELAEALCSPENTPPIEHLTLKTMSWNEEAARWLSGSKLGQNLKSLNLMNNPMRQNGLVSLFGGDENMLGKDYMPNLRQLDVSHCEIDKLPVQGVSWNKLLWLDLSDNPFGSNFFNNVRQVANIPALKVLRLQHAGLSDLAIQILRAGPAWKSLVELDLSKNQLTDLGAKNLLSAPDAPHLVALYLHGNSISEPMMNALSERFRIVIY